MAEQPRFGDALPRGYLLEEYRLTQVLGRGGFGITYKAEDTNLGSLVAIKEFLPSQFAQRDGTQVVPRSEDVIDNLSWGLDRFVEEARTLARFKHPNIVRVHRIFRANGSAYMVTEFEEGETLTRWLRNLGSPPPEDPLKTYTAGLLDALERLHTENFLHRDIKPDNIYLCTDGRALLLDFGSARQALSHRTSSMTAIVTPGYAPLEQYYQDGHQGPWSDIYALGAVLYRAVTGERPPDAPSRVKRDRYQPAAEATTGAYDPKFLRAIDWALRPEENDRPQSIGFWRPALLDLEAAPVPVIAPSSGSMIITIPGPWEGGAAAPPAAPIAEPVSNAPSVQTALRSGGRGDGPMPYRPRPGEASGEDAEAAGGPVAAMGATAGPWPYGRAPSADAPAVSGLVVAGPGAGDPSEEGLIDPRRLPEAPADDAMAAAEPVESESGERARGRRRRETTEEPRRPSRRDRLAQKYKGLQFDGHIEAHLSFVLLTTVVGGTMGWLMTYLHWLVEPGSYTRYWQAFTLEIALGAIATHVILDLILRPGLVRNHDERWPRRWLLPSAIAVCLSLPIGRTLFEIAGRAVTAEFLILGGVSILPLLAGLPAFFPILLMLDYGSRAEPIRWNDAVPVLVLGIVAAVIGLFAVVTFMPGGG